MQVLKEQDRGGGLGVSGGDYPVRSAVGHAGGFQPRQDPPQPTARRLCGWSRGIVVRHLHWCVLGVGPRTHQQPYSLHTFIKIAHTHTRLKHQAEMTALHKLH